MLKYKEYKLKIKMLLFTQLKKNNEKYFHLSEQLEGYDINKNYYEILMKKNKKMMYELEKEISLLKEECKIYKNNLPLSKSIKFSCSAAEYRAQG